MKKWDLQSNFQFPLPAGEAGISNFQKDKLIKILLENRGLKSNKEIIEFLNPKLSSISSKNLEIKKSELDKAIKRIKKAIKEETQIIVFGDYDVDGITGTAILWETLNKMGANVMPYIPNRAKEGYGLSIAAIDNLLKLHKKTKIIITVDNGIVANEAIDYANKLGLEVIVTDHHVPLKRLPRAYAILHSTKVCGAAVAWILSKELGSKSNNHLELVALATVADVMKLTGHNRTLLKLGLEFIRKTSRPGFIEMFKLSGINQSEIGVYELGHIIGPRINAMGRLEHGMDSLRLICTNNNIRALKLAKKLHTTNAKRQELTIESVVHAKKIADKHKKIIIISDKSFNPGIIGLISGRLTEEYYRPSIVISVGEKLSKASARSVKGFNIVEFIRIAKELLVDVGGHPGAAGFTIKTNDIPKLKKVLEKLADKQIDKKLLIRKIKIDCELPLEFVEQKLFDSIQTLAPFGYGNPEPVFLAKKVIVSKMQLVGKEKNHLKLELGSMNHESRMNGIMFGVEKDLKVNNGDEIDIAYSIFENEWQGNKKLELKLRDLKILD